MKPTSRPSNPNFSSGPCAKRPGWSVTVLERACLGRSHRSALGKARLREAIDRSRDLLELPDTHRLAIVPASDTGAMEMALWNLLGPRGVDVLVWESFSKGWASDINDQLRLADVRVHEAAYGELPDFNKIGRDRDIVFAWNGTTSGVCVPDAEWIAGDREGLTICDATSAAFAMELPWDKLDVATWSWQKCLGGEAAHGMIVLGPRAVNRLEQVQPDWPMPKILRLTKKGVLDDALFEGSTINTPSLLCVEDWLDALEWGWSCGGLPGLVARTRGNLEILEDWVSRSDDFGFLAGDAAIRSSTSVCLNVISDWFRSLSDPDQRFKIKQLVALLETEGVAHDIGGYRDAPAGLRVWAGPTIESDDLRSLLPWLEWALAQVAHA